MDPDRLHHEANILAHVFPDVEVGIDPTQGNGWVRIPYFPLPPGWSQTTSDLMILVPSAYPHVPPDSFYIERNLRDRRGRAVGHYFEDSSYNRFSDLGWSWFCYHVHGDAWRPARNPLDGDSLITYVNLLHVVLQGAVN